MQYVRVGFGLTFEAAPGWCMWTMQMHLSVVFVRTSWTMTLCQNNTRMEG